MAFFRPFQRARASTQSDVRAPISPPPFLTVNDRPIMPLFARPQALTAFPTRHDEIDAFLSSEVDGDLEDSFACNMSLHSPPRAKRELCLPSEDDSRDYVPMDISPAPPRVRSPPVEAQPPKRGAESSAHLTAPKLVYGRPRSNTSSGAQRLFGKDLSNGSSAAHGSGTSKDGSVAKGTEKSGKKLQRAALPFEWVRSQTGLASENNTRDSAMRSASKPMDMSSPAADSMDIDMSFASFSSSAPEPPSPLSAAPTITQFRLNVQRAHEDQAESVEPADRSLDNLFYGTMSPRRRSVEALDYVPSSDDVDFDLDTPEKPVHKKKRSLSPPGPALRMGFHSIMLNEEALSSSPALMSSPSCNRLERIQSKGALCTLGLGEPLGLNANNKRPRRPALNPMVQPADTAGGLRSAYPQLESISCGPVRDKQSEAGLFGAPPTRRAFSAMLQLTNSLADQSLTSEGDTSLSMDGPDMSSPAVAYAKRHQVKTLRRCDGTDDFRSMTGTTNLSRRDGDLRAMRKSDEKAERPADAERSTPRSKYLTGFGGFGDNESSGKILPCHRVKEDGLMRISAQTVNELLDGKYDSQIYAFHVIDCRFDYEYDGGHIPGAINMNTTAGVEEFLLGSGVQKPRPSTSGDGSKKIVLVFHCEFSCKRAPTFAKDLRAKDRMLNNRIYPRVHYPEVYVLEGGYCGYYKASSERCEPCAYVTMDDPRYAVSRKEDLDQFRKGKFGRTKSYAYGESKNGLVAAVQQPKRSSAPPREATTALFAGNPTRTRRTNGLLQTLQEDSSITQNTDDEDTDIGDSPCPPPTRTATNKGGRKMSRAPMSRAETYGPSRMTLGR